MDYSRIAATIRCAQYNYADSYKAYKESRNEYKNDIYTEDNVDE